jgi:hypothetical protein
LHQALEFWVRFPNERNQSVWNQTRKRKDFAACAARSRLQLALHAQRTAGLMHVARSAPGRDTRSGQGALARRHTDGPLWAALLKMTVMFEA